MSASSNVHQLFPSSQVILDRKDKHRLLAECLDGNRYAMESLVRLYEKPIYNAAYRMLGNMPDAADATQTTFLKVFQKLNQFDPHYDFFSWIYRIAINEAIDMLKRRSRSESLVKECVADAPGPSDTAIVAEAREKMRRAITELSDDYREVIALKYFNDSSYAQIADALGIAEKTVKSRLYSARQNLRDILRRQQESNL